MPKLYLDICLTDIPKDLIKEGGNGKKYLKAMIAPRREPDKDGFDHFISAYVPQQQRDPDARPIFIGRAQDKEAQQQHVGGQDFRRDNRRRPQAAGPPHGRL